MRVMKLAIQQLIAMVGAMILLPTGFACGDEVGHISSGPGWARSQGLTLSIAYPAGAIALGQPVDMSAKIQNNSTATVRIWRTQRARFKYDVKDEHGRRAPLAANRPYDEISAGSGGWVLAPNQELRFRIRLSDYVVFDHAGTYTVSIEERVPMVSDGSESRVLLTSNVVTFKITR